MPIPYDLTRIRAILFDVDGVLSCDCIPLHPSGEPMRTANIKDGYAMQLAVKKGLHLGIITGGRTEAVRIRFRDLGLQHIYMAASHKTEALNDFLARTGFSPEQVIYVGDDIPDLPIMSKVGVPCAPKDAVAEVRDVALYVSPIEGGKGVARDIIEQVMRAQGIWMGEEAFGW